MPSTTTATGSAAPTRRERNLHCAQPRRVTFVHEVSYLDKPVFEIHEFPEGLASEGWSVHFIDFDEDAVRPRQVRKAVSRLGTSSIDLTSVPSFGSGILRRLIAALVGLVWIPWKLFRSKPDVVVLYAVPTFGWQTVLAGRLLRLPVIYRAIDLSAEIRDTKFSRLVSWAERCVARYATIVCTNTDQLGAHLRSLGAIDVRRVFPGFDRQLSWRSTDQADAIEEWPDRDGYSVVFMGTLFPFAGLEQFIRLSAPVLRRRPELRFRILGSGEAEGTLREVIHQEDLESSIEMPGFVPYEQLFVELSRSSVAVIPFDVRMLTHVALPGKVPQYVRAGLPVVATPLRGLQELLPEGSGVIYRRLGAGFLEAIEDLLDNPQDRRRLVAAGNERLDVAATWNVALSDFEAVLLDAMTERKGKACVG